MSALALALVLLQAAAATPAPTPAPTPTPTPRRRPAGPRTLQDVARDLKLGAKGKGALGTIEAGSSTTSPAPKATPAAAAAPGETPGSAPADSAASVRVTTVSNDGIVDGSGGVRVTGTVRNAGSLAACNVVITVKISDSRGEYLSSGSAAPDIPVIPPGEVVSFRLVVQAPPGVRGARTGPDRRDVTGGSTTMAGEWKVLGGTEATVASASEDCAR